MPGRPPRRRHELPAPTAAVADASHILPLVEWYPSKPTLPQVAFGVVLFLALAGLALYWATDETSTGNRIFLWCLAGLALVLALWRLVAGIRLAREGSARQR